MGKEVRVEGGGDEGVTGLGNDDKVVLFNAITNADDLLNRGRGEAIVGEGGDERGIFMPEAWQLCRMSMHPAGGWEYSGKLEMEGGGTCGET